MRPLAAILLFFLAFLTGCADDGTSVALREWTLSGPNGQTSDVTLPTHLGDRLPASHSHYVLRRTVTLEPGLRGRDVVLVIPLLLAHVALHVDGTVATPIDDLDPNGYRGGGSHAWRIPASDTERGAIRLELDVEHTWTQSGWVDTVPRLTSAPDGGARFVRQRTFNRASAWLALGFALFAGYLYLVIFLTDVRRRTFLWFALTGIGGCLYPLFETGVAQGVLGAGEEAMAAIGVSTAVVTQIHFTYRQFHLPRPHPLWDVAWGVSTLAWPTSTSFPRRRRLHLPIQLLG